MDPETHNITPSTPIVGCLLPHKYRVVVFAKHLLTITYNKLPNAKNILDHLEKWIGAM